MFVQSIYFPIWSLSGKKKRKNIFQQLSPRAVRNAKINKARDDAGHLLIFFVGLTFTILPRLQLDTQDSSSTFRDSSGTSRDSSGLPWPSAGLSPGPSGNLLGILPKPRDAPYHVMSFSRHGVVWKNNVKVKLTVFFFLSLFVL